MYPTRYAVERRQERAVPVRTAEAFRALAAAGRRRRTSRWWNPLEPAPGLLSLYPAAVPGTCLSEPDGAIEPVFERSRRQAWEHDQAHTCGRHGTRGRPYRRPSTGTGLDVVA